MGVEAKTVRDCKKFVGVSGLLCDREALWEDTTRRMQEFQQSLAKFREKLLANGASTIDEGEEDFTWDDVTLHARKAEKYYKGRVTTSPAIARALIKFTQRLKPVREWLDLLKNDRYNCCICGE
jgi:hypothetical protein